MSNHSEILHAKRALENVSLLSKEESRTVSKALAKMKAAQTLTTEEEALCEKVVRLSEAMFCD